jgi:hypothetical protein
MRHFNFFGNPPLGSRVERGCNEIYNDAASVFIDMIQTGLLLSR